MSIRSHWLVLALAAGIASQAGATTLLRRPYLQNAGPDRVSILWAATDTGAGAVEYSADPNFTSYTSVTASAREFSPMESGLPFYWRQYRADLNGLKPGTEYYYRILDNGVALESDETAVSSFRTASPGPFTFLAFGDSGSCSPPQYSLAELMLALPAAFVVHTGDLAYPDATFEQFDNCYFGAYSALMRKISFFPTPGNHEYFTNQGFPYFSVHAFPPNGGDPSHQGRYYSFDWGNAHFVSIDSNFFDQGFDTSTMLRWLEEDLATTKRYWRIVFFHHPVLCAGKHENDQYLGRMREQLVPILDKYDVHLTLAGHTHSYQRSAPFRGGSRQEPGRGTVHIASGGGGGALYPVPERSFLDRAASSHHFLRIDVNGRRLQVRAIGEGGEELDQLILSPPPRIGGDAIVTAGTYSRTIHPGAMINISGANFATEEIRSREFPYPGELSEARVEVSGITLPLSYVSPTRISALLPPDLRGHAVLRVVTPNGSSETEIFVADRFPPPEPDEPSPGKVRWPGQ